MAQASAWEREYQSPQFITKGSKPQKDALRFFKYCRKELGVDLGKVTVLDLGCGIGRNANYLADKYGAKVIGYDISKSAIRDAKKQAQELGVKASFEVRNIGDKYPLKTDSIGIVLDITSSNALTEKERCVYLQEVGRVLKPDGIMFVRALCKDGDKNARELLKNSPGKEEGTYINKDLNLTERVFSKDEIINLYSRKFEILKISKKSGYQRIKNRLFKRSYWVVYLMLTKNTK